MSSNADPITLEVVRGALGSAVLQMRATLLHTAYSPVMYEQGDFSCGLITDRGELIAMSEDFAGHVFAMALGLRAVLEKFEGSIYPGDVLAINDPYTGGTHLNDTAFYTPYFADGRLVLFIAVRAHLEDIGGATPGSFSGQDTEIYQEGVRIVPVKLVDEGRINQGLWDVLFANMRLAHEQEGNALAMLDTARVAEMNLDELCGKYGVGTVEECITAFLDGAEETIRQRIFELPDGQYHYEHYMDCSGLANEPLPIKAKMTIAGDVMTFDFTGTAPQVVGPMNCGTPVTQGGVFVILKCWLDPRTPVNGGTFRPLEFVIPEGSCLAAQLPAAVGGCWDVFHELQSAVIGLFSQAMPWEPSGENPGGVNHVQVGGYDEHRGRHYILYEAPQGGTPAAGDADGATGTFIYDNGGFAAVYPAESTEQRQPLLIEGLAVRTDGEGPGYRRSGFGVTRKVRVLADTSQLNVMTDRAIIPPWGAAGAYAGSLNSFTVLRGGQEIQPSTIPGKIKSFPLQRGDVVVMQASSGGGIGDPLDREVELVEKDVLAGYVTRQRARDVYGVVIEEAEADLAKTEALRRDQRGQRRYFEVVERPEDEFDTRGCRIAPLSRTAASELGVTDGDVIEYVGKAAAPLRAWAKIVEGQSESGVAVGPIARGILNVSGGDSMWVRPVIVQPPEASAGRA